VAARALGGERLEAAEGGGFLTRGVSGDYDMQPLLRTVLLRKLDEEGGDRADRAMHELAAYLIRARRWDEGFAVAERAADALLLEKVVDGALDAMLTESRLETLKQWIARARTDAPSPILDLAEAEVAFREGDPAGALFHATNAASQLPEGHSRLSQSWFRAGQAAYFLDEVGDALTYCGRAKATAATARDTKAALWGLFNAAADLEDEGADSFLNEMESLRPLTLTDQMRLVGGRTFFASRWGGLMPTLGPARALINGISRADPIIQTSFLNHYALGLILAAEYGDALRSVELELSLAEAWSIDFVVPHALLLKSLSCLGLRRFADAQEALATSATSDWPWITLAARTFGARVPLYQGQPGRAVALLDAAPDPNSVPSLSAEFLSTKALALAALGRFAQAREASEEALAASQTIEPRVLAAGATAIVALRERSGDAAELAQHSFRLAIESGNVDSFVCAYRTWPELLNAVASDAELERPLWPLLVRAKDLAVARRVGLRETDFSTWDLTKREAEILNFVAAGLTNKEIAERLFLAQSTVKVHVRHILRKLGVRTRTEAAVRAAHADS